MQQRSCSVLYVFLFCFALVWRCVVTNCGTTYTASSGQISPPNIYRGNYICSPYKILLPRGKRIHLEWKKFNFAGEMPTCTYEFVRISRCTDPVHYIIRYCGPLLPNDFHSYDNCIMIDFRTADSWSKPEDRGEEKFLLRYETLDVSKPLYPVQSSPDCFNILGRDSDNTKAIYTPGWPLSYNAYLGNKLCKTTIPLRENWHIKIVFMDMDLYTPSRLSFRICEDARNDVLTITTISGENLQARNLHYCSKQTPFTRTYSGWLDRIDIVFRPGSSDAHNHTGFALGIAMYEKKYHSAVPQEEDSDGLPGGTIFGIIAITLAFLLIMYCTVKKKTARQGGILPYLRAVRTRHKENRRAQQHRELTAVQDANRPRITNVTTPYMLPAPPYQPPNYLNTSAAMPLYSDSAMGHQPQSAAQPSYASAPPSYDESHAIPPMNMPQYGAPHGHPENPPAYDRALYEHGNTTLPGVK